MQPNNSKYRDKSREPSYTVAEPTTLLPFLLGTLKGKSRNNVKSLLSRKLVTVDGKPTSQFDTPLAPGQVVTILSVSAPKQDTLPFPILFEDEHLIVVNKPAKLLSVGNEKEKVRTAYHMVTDYVKSQHIDNRIFVIHRLDRDTSGRPPRSCSSPVGTTSSPAGAIWRWWRALLAPSETPSTLTWWRPRPT